MKKVLSLLLVLIITGLLFTYWQQSGVSIGETQSTLTTLPIELDTSHFSRATEPGSISFPEDLGPHYDYQTEWWYYTGNLESDNGRQFGFQLTFFRRSIPQVDNNQNSEPIEESSRWHSDQIYMAHFTISDIREDNFFSSERLSRGALGLSGAQPDPYKVWLGDWVVEEKKESLVSLSARSEEVGIHLNLEQRFPPIVHGIDGLSQKGPEPGNASYYYSIVGQYASGEVVIGDSTYQVSGKVWKDHEYGTSALDDNAVGWDWFSIQLDDGTALMFFEIRREDGSLEPFSSGTYIDSHGDSWPLGLGDWQVDILDHWTSPSSGATYPAAWAISIPAYDLILTGRPMMADQELNLSTTYWEGAVAFEGTVEGQPVTGRGYIELTGYSEPLTGRL
jgi:predicted secreted hydrolase